MWNKQTAFSELTQLSTAVEPYESCAHSKCKELYNALSLTKSRTVELAAKLNLNNTGLN
jgi:ferritin-like protein